MITVSPCTDTLCNVVEIFVSKYSYDKRSSDNTPNILSSYSFFFFFDFGIFISFTYFFFFLRFVLNRAIVVLRFSSLILHLRRKLHLRLIFYTAQFARIIINIVNANNNRICIMNSCAFPYPWKCKKKCFLRNAQF